MNLQALDHEGRFCFNKYRTWYFAIIAKAIGEQRSRGHAFYEGHHIFPRSLFGEYRLKRWNKVLLTPREHLICHWLLTKFTSGEDRQKMWLAVWAMTMDRSGQRRRMPMRLIAKARVEQALSNSQARIGKPLSYTVWNKGKKIWDAENRARISAEMRSRPRQSDETIAKIVSKTRGLKRSTETREAISRAKTGQGHSDETRRKMSDQARGRKPWNTGVRSVSPHARETARRVVLLRERGFVSLPLQVQQLNATGWTTARGKRWEVTNLHHVLNRANQLDGPGEALEDAASEGAVVLLVT